MGSRLLDLFRLGRCSHEFSWPRRWPDGEYYQVCLLCGEEYKYDWKTMSRLERVTGLGKMQEGVSDGVAWTLSSMQGPHLKEGDEKAESLLQSKFNSDLNWRDQFKSAETVAVETVEGKECYKVVLTPKAGSPSTRWFDKDTNLLVKMSMTAKSPMGEVQSDSVVSEYRKEGDVLVPHKIISKVATMELQMTVESVQHNPEIPKETFDVPAEVKALMKK